jgi:hypothetical protein
MKISQCGELISGIDTQASHYISKWITLAYEFKKQIL